MSMVMAPEKKNYVQSKLMLKSMNINYVQENPEMKIYITNFFKRILISKASDKFGSNVIGAVLGGIGGFIEQQISHYVEKGFVKECDRPKYRSDVYISEKHVYQVDKVPRIAECIKIILKLGQSSHVSYLAGLARMDYIDYLRFVFTEVNLRDVNTITNEGFRYPAAWDQSPGVTKALELLEQTKARNMIQKADGTFMMKQPQPYKIMKRRCPTDDEGTVYAKRLKESNVVVTTIVGENWETKMDDDMDTVE